MKSIISSMSPFVFMFVVAGFAGTVIGISLPSPFDFFLAAVAGLYIGANFDDWYNSLTK